MEETHHLFVHCRRIYRMWLRVTKLWDINFVGACDVSTCFEIWTKVVLKGLRALI